MEKNITTQILEGIANIKLLMSEIQKLRDRITVLENSITIKGGTT